jgi:hypothetical protein
MAIYTKLAAESASTYGIIDMALASQKYASTAPGSVAAADRVFSTRA